MSGRRVRTPKPIHFININPIEKELIRRLSLRITDPINEIYIYDVKKLSRILSFIRAKHSSRILDLKRRK